jgi:hypothetical protein
VVVSETHEGVGSQFALERGDRGGLGPGE